MALDAREPSEFAAGHILGAINVPLGRLTEAVRLRENEPIIAYCGHGERSSAALSCLEALGYTSLNLDGGTGGWEGAGFELATGAGGDVGEA